MAADSGLSVPSRRGALSDVRARSDGRTGDVTEMPREIAGYRVWTSSRAVDPEWDSFIEGVPGGHHLQTSMWARVKTFLGWRATRLLVAQDDRLVAGAQLLFRPLRVVGAVGYVPKGPVIASEDRTLRSVVMKEMLRVAKANRVLYLAVQPPANGESLGREAPRLGFRPTSLELAPTATVQIDLAQSLDGILAEMHPATRRNVRLGMRRNVVVREASERDLATFYRLLTATSERQHFHEYSEEYIAEMWRAFAPGNHIKLFLAEYDAEPVSALLAVPFGDTVIYKKGAWSGKRGNVRPNEAMHWTAINWAKAHGYRYYDFEGINRELALAIVGGEIPDSAARGVSEFKLGFGRPVLFPQALDYVPNPLLRWTHRLAFDKIRKSAVVNDALNRFRTS